MKASAELWVKLKVTDLVAETSWLTLTEKLDYGDVLFGIVRYSYWSMSAEGDSAEGIAGELDRALSMDSAFINQNKHRYSLKVSGAAGDLSRKGDLASESDFPLRREYGSDKNNVPKAKMALYACDCLIREIGSKKDSGFEERLNGKLNGVGVSGMKAGEIWRVIVGAESEGQAGDILEKMTVTRSRREGLLLNPHYQQYEIIGIHKVKV